jgi:competence protein ComEC
MPPPQTALLNYADGLSRTVQARIVRVRELPARAPNGTAEVDADVDQWEEPGAPTLSLDLSVTAIESLTPEVSRMMPVGGGVRATVLSVVLSRPKSGLTLRCGQLIEAPMRLRIPERYRDPGAWQYADYLLDQDIAATANIPAAKLHVLPKPPSATFACGIFAAQMWAAGRLLGYTRSAANRRLPAIMQLTPDDAGMLNAMLLGDRSRLTRALRVGFERTGSFHLFVVSGLHVALLAGGVLWFARRLGLHEGTVTLLTLAITTVYALITGFGIPVQRALLMTTILLITRLLSRQRNEMNALGAAALAVLVWSPRTLFEASFQMTFLAIVAIAGIAIPLGERSFLPHARAARELDKRWIDGTLPPQLAQLRVMLRLWSEAFAKAFGPRACALPSATLRVTLWAAELALIGAVAEAVMVLPMALYFHRATVFALPANMFSIPLVGVLAPLGLATFCCSLASSWLAAVPGAATALLLHGIAWAISAVGRTSAADLRLPGPTLGPALVAAGCFAASCWAVRRSRGLAYWALILLPIAAVLGLWPERPQLHPGELEVTAIDVGQGDSLFVAGPTGKTMLIDAGGPTGAAANAENAAADSAAFDIGEEVVSPYLWSRQVRRLDVLVLTHAHSDHMGGMPAVLRNLRPRALWVSVNSTAQAFQTLLAQAARLNIPVLFLRAQDHPVFDGLTVNVLAPAAVYINTGRPANNDSLVLRMQFGQSSVLLEGDAEGPSEHNMTVAAKANDGGKLGPVTLLKVGHHGSRTSTTPEFLALAAPQDAIISVGRQNTFGHPRPEIIARLAQVHARVYRTDEFGLTTFLLDRDGRISTLTAASTP